MKHVTMDQFHCDYGSHFSWLITIIQAIVSIVLNIIIYRTFSGKHRTQQLLFVQETFFHS